MANGVYLIDPDGLSGMLDDGTEFVAVDDHDRKCKDGLCGSCVGRGRPTICPDLGQCYAWATPVKGQHRTPPSRTWVFEAKE